MLEVFQLIYIFKQHYAFHIYQLYERNEDRITFKQDPW